MTSALTKSPPDLLHRKEVERRTGLSKSTIYDKLNPKSLRFDPSFPVPVKVSDTEKGGVRWCSDEIDQYIEMRREARDQKN